MYREMSLQSSSSGSAGSAGYGTDSAEVMTVTISDELYANLTKDECEELEKARRLSAAVIGEAARGCSVAWDGLSCWPAVPPSSLLQRSCRLLLLNIDEASGTLRSTMHHLHDEAFAYRRCDSESHWVLNLTNYNACIALINQVNLDVMYSTDSASLLPVAVSAIVSLLSVVSLLLLAIAAGIFSSFTVLSCARTRVHIQLVFALSLHSLSLLMIAAPVLVGHVWPGVVLTHIGTQFPWVCKMTLCVKLYSSNASINWMFVEGHLLHSKVATQVFKPSAPFKAYHAIGWGLPVAFVVPWAVLTELSQPNRACWEGYARHPAVWLLIAPRLVAVLINTVFLVNIVRILISKAKANLTENSQFRAAVKATLVLFPLLGLTHLLFAINPHDTITMPRLKEVYLVLSAAIQSSQGIFVSVIHCFMNGEVQQCIRTACLRAALRRNPNRTVSSGSNFRSFLLAPFGHRRSRKRAPHPDREERHQRYETRRLRSSSEPQANLMSKSDQNTLLKPIGPVNHELVASEIPLYKDTSSPQRPEDTVNIDLTLLCDRVNDRPRFIVAVPAEIRGLHHGASPPRSSRVLRASSIAEV